MMWAEEEFGGADLGDKRLNQRLVLLADRLGEQPSASIPEACRGSAEMHAAYRFLGRETLDWRELMQPHWDASARRMQTHPVVLCIQDTTELDFEGKTTRGLGPLSYEAQRGMYVHPTYAVRPAREPLGVIDAWMWARAFKQGEAPREGIAESLRWLEGYARVAEQAQTLPETRLVYVADREADIVALMRSAGRGTRARRSPVPDGLAPGPGGAHGAPGNPRAASSPARWRGGHGGRERSAGQ